MSGKKNILWLCNTPITEIAEKIGMKTYNEGWLEGISDYLRKEDVQLSILFPQSRRNKVLEGTSGNLKYFGFYRKDLFSKNTDMKTIQVFRKIVRQINPDIIHIFGTEFIHTQEMIKAVGNMKPVIVSIQGLVSFYTLYFMEGIPILEKARVSVLHGKVESIYLEMKKFSKRAVIEKETLKKCRYVIGRTDWDKACTQVLNPECKYYHCNESMRKNFYQNRWSYEGIDKYSILLTQGYYSIKGTHYLIEALKLVKRKFPYVHLNITGSNTFISEQEKTSYGSYIMKLIEKYKLKDNISFLGCHTEEKMCERMLKTHVVVMPSNIENSPNSIGEAMLLGTPVVAADVGGISNLLKHQEEGFLYQHNAPYMLAFYISEIFSSIELAEKISTNERKKASELYDRDVNCNTLLDIYNSISDKKDKLRGK